MPALLIVRSPPCFLRVPLDTITPDIVTSSFCDILQTAVCLGTLLGVFLPLRLQFNSAIEHVDGKFEFEHD